MSIMDYDRVINSAYKCFTLEKFVWFLIFFWLAFPVLVIVPWALEKHYFDSAITPLVYALYAVMYFASLFGFVLLTQMCLVNKRLEHQKITITRFLATIALVFVELWYILVWNLHKSYRVTQLLLLVGVGLLYFYYSSIRTSLIFYSLILFIFAYTLLVIYNSVRLFFTVPSFYHKNISIYQAPKESWGLTHNKFGETLVALILAIGTVGIMLFVLSFILAMIANIVLIQFFTYPISYELSVRGANLFILAPAVLCYYFAITEIFNQLVKEHKSSTIVKKILAKRVLSKKEVPVRKFAKKKTVRKKK